MTCPLLFAHCAEPKVPPRVPRSIIVPFFHTNGCTGGRPVIVFGIAFVNEAPATNPSRSFTDPAETKASGPPKVPRSTFAPSSQMKGWVGAPKNEKGSGSVLIV